MKRRFLCAPPWSNMLRYNWSVVLHISRFLASWPGSLSYPLERLPMVPLPWDLNMRHTGRSQVFNLLAVLLPPDPSFIFISATITKVSDGQSNPVFQWSNLAGCVRCIIFDSPNFFDECSFLADWTLVGFLLLQVNHGHWPTCPTTPARTWPLL